MAGLSSVGIGSGLDLEGLVTKLLDAEKTPKLQALAKREARVQGDISAFGALKSVLDKFRTSLSGLSDASALSPRSAGSSAPGTFIATASSSAEPGSYTVQVLALASAQKLASTAPFANGTALVGEGSLAITSGSTSFQVDTSATTTLTQLKDAINAASGNNGTVSASLLVVDDPDPLAAPDATVTRLVLSAAATGTANQIGIAVTDTDGNNTNASGLSRFYFASGDPASQLSETQAAQDARIAVDGFTANSSTNVFEDVVDGVTITAVDDAADPATLTVSLNTSLLTARVNDFVKAYNDVVNTVRQTSGFNAATGAAGALNGDATVRAIGTQLRGILGDTVDGNSGIRSLADLGLRTQKDGTLTINNAKLGSALSSNFEDFATLFASDDGVATRLKSTLDDYLASDGIIRTRTDGFGEQLKAITAQREALALRLDKLEQGYRDRFIALDSLVSRLQSSSDFLLKQLDNTNKIITGSKGG